MEDSILFNSLNKSDFLMAAFLFLSMLGKQTHAHTQNQTYACTTHT